jgi:hypothetical protein
MLLSILIFEAIAKPAASWKPPNGWHDRVIANRVIANRVIANCNTAQNGLKWAVFRPREWQRRFALRQRHKQNLTDAGKRNQGRGFRDGGDITL